jgi:hypothetical protein
VTTNGIHKRGLTSFFTLFGFIIMSISGLVLYVVPAGRVAYWTDWQLLGLSKTDWDNIHILSSILFIVAGATHTYLNWKPLMNYFKDRTRKTIKLRREFTISSIITVWIIVAAIWPFPPLSYLLDFNDWIKTTWVAEEDYEPPFGHAELLSLATFSKKMDIDLTSAVQELKANDIIFESAKQTLEEIAKDNDMSAMNLYLLIKKFEPAPEPERLDSYTPETIEVEFAGTGIGNKTLASMCERLGLDTTVAVNRLEAAGIDADLSRTFKAVAQGAGVMPIEVMKVILLDRYIPVAAE